MTYCERCERRFRFPSAYQQHVANSSNHHICYECDKDFDTWAALRQHYIQSTRHDFCRQCNTHFDDEDKLLQHCIKVHHFCRKCRQFFKSATGLHEHNRQCHHYCAECQLVYSSANNLREHMNSHVHRPRNVACAFQFHGCGQSFVKKSAMILHLESGTCPSGADREAINRWVRVHDRTNAITDPSRLLTDGDTVVRRFATERSWNGDAYECVLCHKAFGTLVSLNLHLASPRHEERIYRCPLSSCFMNFSTLSALCQHVESESCGVLRFKAVQQGMDKFFGHVHQLRIECELDDLTTAECAECMRC